MSGDKERHVQPTIADTYTEEEWTEIAAEAPLDELGVNDVYSLHRYWMWTNYQRELHYWFLQNEPRDEVDVLRSKQASAMYLWYSLLWSLIEGLQDRGVKFSGEMKSDVDYLGDRLRRCRNAVFHVPKNGQWDDRLFEIMFDGPVGGPESSSDQESVGRIRRLTSGLGRLFLEEPARRGLGQGAAGPRASEK